jgi:hypothetical protein
MGLGLRLETINYSPREASHIENVRERIKACIITEVGYSPTVAQ